MSSKAIPVTGTGSIGNTHYHGRGARPYLRQAQQSGQPGGSGQQDSADLCAGTPPRVLREDKDKKAPDKSVLSRVPDWGELLNESNDKIRWWTIQAKRLAAKPVPTPDIMNKTLKDAVSILKSRGLSITKICQEYSLDAPVGRILVQMPSPGSLATPDAGVAVVVSKGPVPDQEFDLWSYREAVPPSPKEDTATRKVGIKA